MIDKLPFAAPDDPVFEARLDAIRRAGGNPFRDEQLPQAVIALKQGVGRLIRSETDRGVLVLCDPRLLGKAYGRCSWIRCRRSRARGMWRRGGVFRGSRQLKPSLPPSRECEQKRLRFPTEPIPDSMKLLAFETATEACSVALWIDGDVRERFEVAPRRHAELVLPWAEQLLAEAGIAQSQLDAIAVGRGPGAFTGVRLAIALAQGIALALDRPVVPVSTLAALAMRAKQRGMRRTSRRPRRHRRAHGRGLFRRIPHRDSAPLAISEERVSPPEAITLPDDDTRWLGVGTGFAAADGALRRDLDERLLAVDATALPHAADVADLAAAAFARGEALPPERLEPAYLRDHVALTLVEQQARRDAR